MAAAASTTRRVFTPQSILSYPAFLEPKPDDNGVLKYQAAFVMPAGSDLSKLEAAILLAANEKFPNGIKVGVKQFTVEESFAAAKANPALKGHLHHPFRFDGDTKGYPDGSTFFNAKSGNKPGIVWNYADVDGRSKKMTDAEIGDKLYPGVIVIGLVTAFGYDQKGNKGVSFAIDGVQFVKDAPRIDSRVKAEDAFPALDSVPDDISALTR